MLSNPCPPGRTWIEHRAFAVGDARPLLESHHSRGHHVLPQPVSLTGVLAILFAIGSTRAQSGAIPVRSTMTRYLAAPGVRIDVFYFAATDCPISNRYVPEIQRLDREYASQGVRVWWIYPNPTDDSAAIAHHRVEFGITGRIFPDPPESAVSLAHATITPEAAVFVVDSGELREVYRGRIDDRYISIGQERPQPTRHDLELAISAALAGKPVPQPDGPPVGCAIVPPRR